jgi:hypothetical protein
MVVVAYLKNTETGIEIKVLRKTTKFFILMAYLATGIITYDLMDSQ